MLFSHLHWWVYIYDMYHTTYNSQVALRRTSVLPFKPRWRAILEWRVIKPMKKWMLTSHFCCGKNFHNVVPVVGCIVVSRRWVPLHPQQIQVAEMMPHRYTAVVGWKRRWTAELHKKTIIPDQFIYHATTSYLSVFSARGSSNKHSYKRNVGFLL